MLRSVFSFFPVMGLLLAAPAVAMDAEVKVAEHGANATEARTKAMAAAERKAFERILIDKVPQQAAKLAKVYDDEAISQMVQGYQIVKEAMTPDTYRGTVKVTFDDSALEKVIGTVALAEVIKGKEVASAMAQSQAVLLLPVWFDENGILLWESGNLWRSAVNQTALQARAGVWISPFGDPTDMLTVDSTNIENVDYAKLAPLAERYGAGSILVAIAKPGARVLAVELRHLTPAGEENESMTVEATDNATKAEDLIQQAADELLLGTERNDPAALTGKQKAIRPEFSKEAQIHEINLLLHLKQARDWAELNHRLRSIDGVESLQVVVADWQRMQMQMRYRGAPDELGESLAKVGLAVQQEGEMLRVAIR